MSSDSESAYWNERVLNWAKSRANTPFNTPFNTPLDLPFDLSLDTSLDVKMDTPPLQPLFLEENNYLLLKESLEYIKDRIEIFFVESNISFEFTNIGTYAYKCKYKLSKENCDFRINLFTAIDGFIVQIERWSDDGFGFLHITDAFRKFFKNIV